MIYVIQNNIPRCPKCAAMMEERLYAHRYFICECGFIGVVADVNKSDGELVISDKEDKS